MAELGFRHKQENARELILHLCASLDLAVKLIQFKILFFCVIIKLMSVSLARLKSLKLVSPQLSHLANGESNHCTSLIELFVIFREDVYIKPFVQSRIQRC